MKALNALRISGRDVLPLVEGGKGISISNGESSGAWARSGGVGTFSGVNADSKDPNGRTIGKQPMRPGRDDGSRAPIATAAPGFDLPQCRTAGRSG